MEPSQVEKISTNISLGAVLIVMAWQLPGIIKLFLEHRKEVAIEMNGQTAKHTETVEKLIEANKDQTDKLIEANKEQNKEIIDKFDKRFEKIEEAITTLANTQIQNQEIIKGLLGGRTNEQRSLPAGHSVSA